GADAVTPEVAAPTPTSHQQKRAALANTEPADRMEQPVLPPTRSVATLPVEEVKHMDTSGAPIVREIQARIVEDAVRQYVTTHADDTRQQDNVVDPGSQASVDDSDQQGKDDAWQRTTDCEFLIPDIFTPNNDGTNDAFSVKAPPCITSARIRIFSLNGQLVHVMNNYEPWTGANCDEGWYLVAGEATTTSEGKVPVKGLVLLKRGGNN
ncbi:MAG TPA: gliding motility-associated C-terminal domain-containing protein, partial [Flavobacteriales bacterium]|nr:gliding motility-associated C-terminal domain-containing protein [Flavobacteriales bacterium]